VDAPIKVSSAERLTPPEDLSGMALLQAVYEAEGEMLVGSPSAGFACFAKSTDTLVIICAARPKVEYVSLERIMTNHALKAAQDLGGSFLVNGAQVLCSIRGITQVGDSYGQAAMRAILAFERSEYLQQETA
jgi:hypothetical protein